MLTKSIFSAIGLLALTFVPLASAQDSGTGFVFKCNRPGVVALTFDDGPGAYSQELLDILANKSVKTTYFVIGANVETTSAGLVSEYNAGHQIALHTYTHPHLNNLTAAEQTSEITKTRDLVKTTIGVTPVYMRPPYGECLEPCGSTMRGLGYTVTMWNLDSNDWTYETNLTYSHELYDNIMKGITPSDPTKDSFIILQHEIDEYSVKLVPDIIDAIRAKGYTFDTIAGCTGGAAPYVEGWGNVKNGTNSTVPTSSVLTASVSANATASLSSASVKSSGVVTSYTSISAAPTISAGGAGAGSNTTSAPSASRSGSGASAVSYSVAMFVAVVGAMTVLAL